MKRKRAEGAKPRAPRKRKAGPRKRKASKKRKAHKRAAPLFGGVARRTGRRPRSKRGKLHIQVQVPPGLRLDSPELGTELCPAKRLELAGLGHRKSVRARPSWAADERTWSRAMRSVSPYWGRYEHPYAAVAFVYLRSGGRVVAAHHSSGHREHAPRGHRVEAQRVELDELGYDATGQYWGRGSPLWRVNGPDGEVIVRARTAQDARAQAQRMS